jgi:hypothetical protein
MVREMSQGGRRSPSDKALEKLKALVSADATIEGSVCAAFCADLEGPNPATLEKLWAVLREGVEVDSDSTYSP